jgi:hypothetical protein
MSMREKEPNADSWLRSKIANELNHQAKTPPVSYEQVDEELTRRLKDARAWRTFRHDIADHKQREKDMQITYHLN